MTRDGPNRMRSSEPTVPTLMRVPAGQRGRRRGHPPVGAATGSLLRAGQRGPEHERVRARGDRLGQLAAAAHAAVRDDRHVAAGVIEERVASGGHVADGGHLRHADAQHLARGARGARAHAHEDRRDALAHQLVGGVIRGGVADRDRDAHPARELGQLERVVAGGEVAGGAHLRLDEEQVRAVLGAERAPLLGGAPGVAATIAGEPAACSCSRRSATRSSRMGLLYASASSAGQVLRRGRRRSWPARRPGRRSAPGRPPGSGPRRRPGGPARRRVGRPRRRPWRRRGWGSRAAGQPGRWRCPPPRARRSPCPARARRHRSRRWAGWSRPWTADGGAWRWGLPGGSVTIDTGDGGSRCSPGDAPPRCSGLQGSIDR